MIVDRLLRDLDLPDPEEHAGNAIRGSRLGRCARQSAYMLFPRAFPPEPLPARAKLVFRFGDLIHELVRAEFRRVVPGEWGMEEERFHFRVPLAIKEAEAALTHFRSRRLVGSVYQRGERPAHLRGLYLDVSEPALYVPLHVDGVADLTPFGGPGLATVEIKSMATGSFRRALQGHVDYAYRVQMAVACAAAGLDTEMYVAVRKDTCHLLEVVYTKEARAVSVTFTKHSQIVESLRARALYPGGSKAFDGEDWEAALVRHPFEPGLLEEAQARVRRVLLATVTSLPEREYGPTFVCETCEGTGTQVNAKGTGQPLKKGPKPCADCDRGQVEEAELPWQCSYCPSVFSCYAEAKVRLDVDERPHFRVRREEYEASGITYRRPE